MQPVITSLQGMERELAKANKKATRAGAVLVQKSLLASARSKNRDTFRGRPLTVTVKSYDRVSMGWAGRSTAAWVIADEGAKAHVIKPRRAKALNIGGDIRSGPVKHPGTRGTNAWTAGLRDAEPRVDDVVDKTLSEALTKGFG